MLSNNHSRFVVLEGVDGAGKTTLSREVADQLRGFDFVFCSRKEVMSGDPFIASQMNKIASLMWTDNKGATDHLLPTYYWLHLQSVWYTLLFQFVIEPLLAQRKNVVVDGWFYKFMARLLIRDFDFQYLNTFFPIFLSPM